MGAISLESVASSKCSYWMGVSAHVIQTFPKEGGGLHVSVVPGSFLPTANSDNDYLIDRERQKTGVHYSGVPGIGNQDTAIQETMSPLNARREHLVSIDRFIVAMRRRLTSISRNASDSQALPGAAPAHQMVRSASVVLPITEDMFQSMVNATRYRAGEPFVAA